MDKLRILTEVLDSSAYQTLSRNARYVYIGALACADDQGLADLRPEIRRLKLKYRISEPEDELFGKITEELSKMNLSQHLMKVSEIPSV